LNDRVITWVVLKYLILKLARGVVFRLKKWHIFFLVVLQPFSDILFLICAADDKRAFNVSGIHNPNYALSSWKQLVREVLELNVRFLGRKIKA